MGWIDLEDKLKLQNYKKEFLLEERRYRLTPFIVTLCAGGLTPIDLQNMMEAGLHVCRFRMGHITREDRIELLEVLKSAVKLCCEKYMKNYWPIAISIDLPNAAIRTGTFSKNLEYTQVLIKKDSHIQLTSDPIYMYSCTKDIIYVDDAMTLKNIKVGMEVTLNSGQIVTTCTKLIDSENIICKVVAEGFLEPNCYVSIRGLKHARRPLSVRDLTLLDFAKEFKLDIVTINYLRYPATIRKVRKMLEYENGHCPLILAAICEQEGLDNAENIVKEADGIILARECIAYEILHIHKMPAIQWHITALCKQAGKPFFVSGNILDETMNAGRIVLKDVSDITNAFIDGAGVIIKNFVNPTSLSKALTILDDFTKTLEPLSAKHDFWRLHEEVKMPVNAAEAASMSCVLASKLYGAMVIFLISVTGRAAISLASLSPEAVIVAITKDPFVANKLCFYNGIYPVVYDVPTMRHWHAEMSARIQFGIDYSIKRGLLKYDERYVIFEKGPTSSYNDIVSYWHLSPNINYSKNAAECEINH